MYVCFAYKNREIKVRRIKRFSDLSTDNSDFYYYEEDVDAWGQGTCVRKDEILCIEIAPYPKADWPEETKKERPHPEPAYKPLKFAGEVPRPVGYAIDPFNPHPGM